MTNNSQRGVSFLIYTHSNECHCLQLSPQNYQRQFTLFLQHNKLSKQQAISLKTQIQKALTHRVSQIQEGLHSSADKYSNQKNNLQQGVSQASNPNQAKTTKYEESLISKQGLPQYGKQFKQFQPPLQKSDIYLQNKNETKESIRRSQNNCQSDSKEAGQKEQTKLKVELFSKIGQFSLANSKVSMNKEEITGAWHSPRFNDEGDQKNYQQDESFYGNAQKDQQDTEPRKIPKMSPCLASQIEAKNIQSDRGKRLEIEFSKFSDLRNQEKNKKLVLLQNYSGHKQGKSETGPASTNMRDSPQPKPGVEVYKRLYEMQTVSFKSKRQKEINIKQQEQYSEYLKHAQLNKKKLTYHQDMSRKTTQSFRAKKNPEYDSQAAKQLQSYQASFLQHLKRKQADKRIRENHLKKREIEGQKMELRGSRCQSKILREALCKKQKDLRQRREQIKARIQQEKRLNIHRDLSIKSFSPATQSKQKSRECASCSPEQAKGKKGGRKKQAVIGCGRNKKYVSNILKQCYAQFWSSAKKL